MPSQLFYRSILVTLLLIFASAFARAEIAQCVDDKGRITFTDRGCNANSDSMPAAAMMFSFPGKAKAPVAAAAGERSSATVRLPQASSGLSLDMMTVQAAQSAMVASEQPWSLLRREQLATLAQR